MLPKPRIASCLALVAALSWGCSNHPSNETPAKTDAPAKANFKIGVMTGTVSQGEEDYRAGQQVAARYPGRVNTVTFPDNFSSEIETVVSQLVGLAADPAVKVVIAGQAINGSVAAARKIREQRPDVLIGLMSPHEDPSVAEEVSDLATTTDELARGTTLIENAQKMGAKHFVQYSFPRHMSMVLLSRQRDIMIRECARLGVQFHFVTGPDPTGEGGLPGTQQFILEDVPRELARYGPQTAFNTTNDGMQEPLIKAVLDARQGYIVEQASPGPISGYPAVLGIRIPPDKAGDMAWISAENKRRIAELGMSGHFGAWSQSIDMVSIRAMAALLVDGAAGKIDVRDSATVRRYLETEAGGPVTMRRYSPKGNLWMILMEHVTY